jgi:hypothetical protein
MCELLAFSQCHSSYGYAASTCAILHSAEVLKVKKATTFARLSTTGAATGNFSTLNSTLTMRCVLRIDHYKHSAFTDLSIEHS